MKDIIVLHDKLALIEKELKTLTEKLSGLETALKDFGELNREIKGLKVFLGRVYPDFKSQFPEIMKKIGE
ncbi:MAG TPA: hypothetical protein VLD40_06660 [Dissulfurispiraceae bacterium]|nr:hypothetical protein [Dissulfurispiraceae bacterium]